MEPCIYLKSELGEVFLLLEGNAIAGRNPEAPFRIDHPAVSPHHASFFRRQDQIWVTDLGSSNGTFVNESQVVTNQWHPLQDGDIVRFGRETTLRVYRSEASS